MKYFILISALFTFLVSSAYTQDTVHVKTGWNIIGSLKGGAIPDVLSTVPDSLITSSYFGYTPGVGYQSTDTLDNGTGYWVKARSDGLIVFNNAPQVDSCKSKAFIYEGKLYNTVKIGDQCWMAENLDVGVMVTGVTEQTDNDTVEKYCYNDSLQNCALYGGLYQWNEAMQYVTTGGARGICPTGWHVPTESDFQTLSSTVGNDGNTLKTRGQGVESGVGTNTSGFSALLAGARFFDGHYYTIGGSSFFWSSTEFDTTDSYYMSITQRVSNIWLVNSEKSYGLGVRCLED